jgi:glycerol-3-phosphate dehydrogenase
LLTEAEDFASGSSSKSTKLIHGGVRYLEKAFWSLDRGKFQYFTEKQHIHTHTCIGALMLVFEALQERAYFLNAAPYLCSPLPLVTPCYSWWEGPYYWAGLIVYDW